jgi:hypothetical protein
MPATTHRRLFRRGAIRPHPPWPLKETDLNSNTPRGTADLAAAIQLSHQKVHRAVVARIWELFDGGLSPAEITAQTTYPPALVRMVLRGGSPQRSSEMRSDETKPAPAADVADAVRKQIHQRQQLAAAERLATRVFKLFAPPGAKP